MYGQAQHHVIVNLTENTDGTYDYEEITLPVGVWDRDAIINAIVRAHYSQDKAESIVFNHLLTDDMEKEKHEAEYEAMQEWREKAKKWADEAIAAEKDEALKGAAQNGGTTAAEGGSAQN